MLWKISLPLQPPPNHSALRTLGRLPSTLFALKMYLLKKFFTEVFLEVLKYPRKVPEKKVTALFKAFMRKFDTKPEIWLRQKKPKTP